MRQQLIMLLKGKLIVITVTRCTENCNFRLYIVTSHHDVDTRVQNCIREEGKTFSCTHFIPYWVYDIYLFINSSLTFRMHINTREFKRDDGSQIIIPPEKLDIFRLLFMWRHFKVTVCEVDWNATCVPSMQNSWNFNDDASEKTHINRFKNLKTANFDGKHDKGIFSKANIFVCDINISLLL